MKRNFTLKDIQEYIKDAYGYNCKYNIIYDEKLQNYRKVTINDFGKSHIQFVFWRNRKGFIKKVYVDENHFLFYNRITNKLEKDDSNIWQKFLARQYNKTI